MTDIEKDPMLEQKTSWVRRTRLGAYIAKVFHEDTDPEVDARFPSPPNTAKPRKKVKPFNKEAFLEDQELFFPDAKNRIDKALGSYKLQLSMSQRLRHPHKTWREIRELRNAEWHWFRAAQILKAASVPIAETRVSRRINSQSTALAQAPEPLPDLSPLPPQPQSSDSLPQ